jgi:hypothetical protein
VLRNGLVLALCLSACKEGPEEELKLRQRDKDAGPAVLIVEKGAQTALPQSDEHEPNDARSGGQVIGVPGAIRGRLAPPGDWDVFTFKAPQAGTLEVKLSAVDGVDLLLEIQDEQGEVLVISDNGGPKVAEAIPNLFIQPSKYRIAVNVAAPKKEPKPTRKKTPDAGVVIAPPVVVYLLEVSFGPVPGPGVERETNDEISLAEDLPLGTVGKGHLGWRRDVDLWKIPLAEVQDDESLSVDVDGIPDVTLRVAVQNGEGKTLLERKGKASEAVALRGLGAKPGEPFFYVAISGDRSSEEPYTVRAQAGTREVEDEVEPNDAVATANPLIAGASVDSGQRFGLVGRGDVDLFRVEPASTPRLLSVRVEPPSGVDVDVIILGADGKAALSGLASAGKRGGAEALTMVPVPAGETAHVKVIGKSGDAGDERYRLGWALAAGEP